MRDVGVQRERASEERLVRFDTQNPPGNERIACHFLGEILRREGITTVMVTHDIPESISMGDRVLILSARPACVKEILTLDFGDDRTPLSCRSNPRFQDYFDHIWKELGVHE